MLLYAAVLPAARGDSEPVVNPHAQEDPDGVPLSVAQPQEGSSRRRRKSRPAQKAQQQNKDWLLRNYEQQQQTRNGVNSSQNPSLSGLSSDKDLARLANLPTLDSVAPGQVAPLRTGTGSRNAPALRADPSSKTGGLSESSFHDTLLKPLVDPLSTPETEGLHPFHTFLPSVSTPLVPPSSSATRAPELNQESPSTMDIPGLTAAGGR